MASGKKRVAPVGELKKKIKHISNRNFQFKMVPLNAECFKLFKYMCFCPKRSFVACTGGRKVGSHLKIEAKNQETATTIDHYLLLYNTQ